MEKQRDISGMLDLITVPGFRVKDQTVIQVNAAARKLLIAEGTPLEELLFTGSEEYASYQGGCLYLGIQIAGSVRGARVNRVDGEDIFLLDQDSDPAELTSLALAARELREPLTRVMHAAQKLFEDTQNEEAAKLNRGLHQMLRILGNMTDASEYSRGARLETLNISALIGEIFEKADGLLSAAGVTLGYQGLPEPVFSLADGAQLERAILNVLSNALKFTAAGGTVSASLTRRGKTLYLRILDSGCGIADELLPTVFSRYTRSPAIEDSRQGLGLGMVLIRSAAINHGGTVLIERPQEGGTAITLTLAIRQNPAAILRSPALFVDYSGGLDHMLLEFSESLPAHFYTPEK